MKRSATLLAVVFILLSTGCGDPKYEPPQFQPVEPDKAITKTLTGEVRFEGAPPPPRLEGMGGSAECTMLHSEKPLAKDLLVKNGRVQNVFVYVKSGLDPKYRFAIPAGEHVINNEKCRYEPRVSGARVWQKIRLGNQDPTQHNIRSEYWSKTLFTKGQAAVVWIEKEQMMLQLRCDLHNWMIGYVGVLDHPFFSVTGEEGVFAIRDLPPGKYVLEAWHETLGTQTREVAVEAPKDPKETEQRLPPFTFKR